MFVDYYALLEIEPLVQTPVKLTTVGRFKLTTPGRSKLTMLGRAKLTT